MATTIPQWGCFERPFTSDREYHNPLQDAALQATFVSPSGQTYTVDGFWDGGPTWRVRFAPNELGAWTYRTMCSDTDNGGLHGQTGEFRCAQPVQGSRFTEHGPLRLADNRRYLVHADGTPFLWLGDTAWNGPLLSSDDEWQYYLDQRRRQGFTAVQWVATHWRASPQGDREGQLAYSGLEQVQVNPAFFQRLDRRVRALMEVGLLSVPVLLWSHPGRGEETARLTPGHSLPEDQAALLARYMVARWGAYPNAWILPGDGDYRGERAGRWQRIGRAVFGGRPHAPVSLHPQGMHWNMAEFGDEDWLDLVGYQSGHGDDNATLGWLVTGPPATDWTREPARPILNLEPPYEDHIAYQSRERFTANGVRRALYWSLLVSPPAGVTYGAHGVWGWDDGTKPPTDHPSTGIPRPWREALHLAGAEQMAHLADLFASLPWWTLQPAQDMLVSQPGESDKTRYVVAARSDAGGLALVYTPTGEPLALDLTRLAPGLAATWFNPRTGEQQPASPVSGERSQTVAPGGGDWLLVLAPSQEEADG